MMSSAGSQLSNSGCNSLSVMQMRYLDRLAVTDGLLLIYDGCSIQEMILATCVSYVKLAS